MKVWWLILAGFVLSFLFFRRSRTEQGTPTTVVPSPPNRLPASRRKRAAASFVGGIPADFQLTPEFSQAFTLMENSSRNIFITGKAGTGKSTLLQYFKEKTKKKIVIVAPTGIAAINVGGSTIHSFFRLPPRLVKREDVKVILQKREVFGNLDAVVIDEVSMVRADMMDAIDQSLRINRKRLTEPFGGVQMIFIGDLYQLPPVVESGLSEYFSDTFSSPFFFSANVFKWTRIKKIELQKIFRQTDGEFIGILNKVRDSSVTLTDLQVLNQRHNSGQNGGDDGFAITLTSTNALANDINQLRLDSLAGRDHYFSAVVSGEFDEKSFPTDRQLRLREGAQIMMVKNDLDKRWVNGSLGVIQKLSTGSIKVSFGDSSYPVEPMVWEKIDYEYDPEEKKIEPIVVGSFRQYPIKLAWAVTIHKSQGKTFDKVIIDLGNGAFAHGQAYVALSRCRSLEGIRLRTPLKISDVILDNRVVEFLSRSDFSSQEQNV